MGLPFMMLLFNEPDHGSTGSFPDNCCPPNWVLLCEAVRPAQGSKTPKSGKEGFGVGKPPLPPTPEKGVSNQKIPPRFPI